MNSQKHGIHRVKICRCSNGICVVTTFDHIAIYERDMRDYTLCHRHLMYVREYLAIDGMEMLLACLFLVLTQDDKRRFICFRSSHIDCSKMAELYLTVHRLLEWNLYQEDRMMSPRVLKISVCKSRPVRTLSSLQKGTVIFHFYCDYWCKILNCA
jgi:hypothetical protein